MMGGDLDKLFKLQSRLRNVANANADVNFTRAAISGSVKLRSDREADFRSLEAAAPEVTMAASPRERGSVRIADRGKQTALSENINVSVFVLTDGIDLPPQVSETTGRIGTAIVPISELPALNADRSVRSIELAETLKQPNPQVGGARRTRPVSDALKTINRKWHRLEKFDPDQPNKAFKDLKRLGPIGENVLVGIIDVGGLDFAHRDFLIKGEGKDEFTSRVIAIWDQGGDAFDPPANIAGDPANNGSEITAEHIAYAMAEHRKLKVTPYDLAPQSQQLIGSHATHVASIAAGNGGVCQRAKIAGVMISLPEADQERRRSFYDTGRIVAAVDYLLKLKEREGFEAVVINISLGTNGGSHDGSELVSRWLDHNLFDPGRVVCVAAGNSGQEAARFEGDIGHYTGRIHAKGRIPAAGLIRDLEWVVLGNGVEDISENEMELWYPPSDEFTVAIKPPDGAWIGPVGPRERIENLMLANGTFVSIYNELNDPKNGDNKISIYLGPFMKGRIIGIQPGTWRIRLVGKVIRDGSYHAWIERDDPGRSGTISKHWRLPSFFGDASYVDESTVSSLACGPRVIGVANLDEAREMIAVSSSQGPTRDGRSKPDIAAPGTGIVAAKGFDPDEEWVEMSGTSMASPYVCGVAGLMLSIAPHLTAAQIGGIIRRTSRPLPGGGFDWHNASGFGVIDPFGCLKGVGDLLAPVRDTTDKLMKKRAKP